MDALFAAWQVRDVSALPAWFVDRQRHALDAARASAWPARKDEAWKYTSLHSLEQSTFADADFDPHGKFVAPDLPGLTFVDGRVSGSNTKSIPQGVELQSLYQALRQDSQPLRFIVGHESESGDVFDHLNAAFAVDGGWLRVDTGIDAGDWLTLRCEGETAAHWHLGHTIEVGEHARLRLCIELVNAGNLSSLTTIATRIHVQRGGQLDLAWIAEPGQAASIARTRIDLEENAQLRLHVLDDGSLPSRHDLKIRLRGEGADAQLGGIFMIEGMAHADTQLDLHHEAPGTSSQTTWRVIARDRGRAVFNGRIVVQPGADGTDAQLACKSLLLSGQAEVDVKPVLEIHADDVKCAHGATVGQLDEQALFYLRSRGLDGTAARGLLMQAFAAEALAGIERSPVAAVLDRRLDAIAP